MNTQSFYSESNAGQLLHVIANAANPGDSRVDLSPPDQFLQVSILPLPQGKAVSPHIHEERQSPPPASTITQECWVVLSGRLHIRLFDLDHKLLHEGDLSQGHLLVTFNGGHSLECIGSDTVMLEVKNGPYLGRDFKAINET